MAERPILFAGRLVRALLAGEKTVTRRLMTSATSLVDGRGPTARHFSHLALRAHDNPYVDPGPSPAGNAGPYLHVLCNNGCGDHVVHRVYPRIQPEDVLWVRETWTPADDVVFGSECEDPQCIAYRADESILEWSTEYGETLKSVALNATGIRFDAMTWRPSIFMPRWACRLRLRVVSVRPERLHEITGEDVEREGIRTPVVAPTPELRAEALRGAFSSAWDSLNGKRAPWDSNPWVWRVEFSRVQP